jgi:hypothetical protein
VASFAVACRNACCKGSVTRRFIWIGFMIVILSEDDDRHPTITLTLLTSQLS